MIRNIFIFALSSAFALGAITQNSPSQLFEQFEEAIGYIDSVQNSPKIAKPVAPSKTQQTPKPSYSAKPTTRISGGNNLRTTCSTPGFITPEIYSGDDLMHSFNTGEEIRYKHSARDSVFYLRLSNFSLERIRDNILQDKERFLIQSDFTASNSNKKSTSLAGAS